MADQNAHLPKTRAKTAYGLLTAIRRLILAEPKRYNQQRFIQRVNGVAGADLINMNDAEFVPACGTIGCVAGWVTTLVLGPTLRYGEIGDAAEKILGLPCRNTLFQASAARGCPQTIDHAISGEAHIAAFQRKNAKKLKAKRIKYPKKSARA